MNTLTYICGFSLFSTKVYAWLHRAHVFDTFILDELGEYFIATNNIELGITRTNGVGNHNYFIIIRYLILNYVLAPPYEPIDCIPFYTTKIVSLSM